jgi:hypothetical protein
MPILALTSYLHIYMKVLIIINFLVVAASCFCSFRKEINLGIVSAFFPKETKNKNLVGYCPTLVYKDKTRQKIHGILLGSQKLVARLTQPCQNIASILLFKTWECLPKDEVKTVIDGEESYHKRSNTFYPFMISEEIKRDAVRMANMTAFVKKQYKLKIEQEKKKREAKFNESL